MWIPAALEGRRKGLVSKDSDPPICLFTAVPEHTQAVKELGAPRGWSPVQIQQVVEGGEGSKLKEMNKCQCLVTFLCVSADRNVSVCAHYCVPHTSTYLVYVGFSRILVKGLVCSCVWCFRHAECPNKMK